MKYWHRYKAGHSQEIFTGVEEATSPVRSNVHTAMCRSASCQVLTLGFFDSRFLRDNVAWPVFFLAVQAVSPGRDHW